MAESDLAALPRVWGLAEGAAEVFGRQRRAIHQRHRTWRATMPAIDALFDDDCHRAKALAGNLATELEASLLAWARLRDPTNGRQECNRWIRSQVEVWTSIARPMGRAPGWGDEAEAVFDGFLGELCARAEARALAALAREGEAGDRGLAKRMVRLARWPAFVLARLFRPDRNVS